MFVATALLYPCVLAVLCLGAGLLVDRLSGSFLPAALLGAVGAAALIALSQIFTYVPGLAPATPYAMAAAAVAGLALARTRVAHLFSRAHAHAWPIAAAVLAYALALAPVLAAGRVSFSSYMALADSAVHLLGADYLLRHGQHYAHLDLRNSYGQFVNNYYNRSYPSGADTMFGGSASLLGLSLMWAFQPFNAYMLATAVGPAWLLARKLGLNGVGAALAALTAAAPALVYAYALFGSIKEITSLPLILALGCLVAIHRSWLRAPPRGALPFALVLAGGVSALGLAFGAWALVAVAVLGAVMAYQLRGGIAAGRAGALLIAAAAAALLVAAWPTWIDLPGSLQVAQNIAATANPGNLHSPLRAEQVLGVWLGGSYKLAPGGAALTATYVLMALTLAAAAAGAANLLLRLRGYALAGWFALMLVAWLVVSASVTTWGSAKTLMLTSPAVMLLAWGGVAALTGLRPAPRDRSSGAPRAAPKRVSVRVLALPAAVGLALALAGGVLASDALQYRASDLAPTARYEELASLDARFAGEGPVLFTDFDEYSMYELRDLDVGGPDFVYPPAALGAAAAGYGDPVDLNRVAPAALAPYPLIVTRRDPSASRPPAAYRLVWHGSYYEVWRRRPNPPPVLAQTTLTGTHRAQCKAIERLAGTAGFHGRRLVASEARQTISISLALRARPRGWGRERDGLTMKRPGSLTTTFRLPAAGVWKLWVQGQIMPTVTLAIDGRTVQSVSDELDGNSLVPNTVPPVTLLLPAGRHRLTVTRPAFNLTPGDEGSAVLDAVTLTPAGEPEGGVLRRVRVRAWRTLCGRSYQWVELLGA